MIAKVEGELVAKALRINDLNKSAVKSFLEWDTYRLSKVLGEFGDLKREIKTTLIEFPVVKINNKRAQEIIRKISLEEDLPIDKIIKGLEERAGEIIIYDDVFAGLDDDEIWGMGDTLLYSWFSHYEYVEGLFGISSLILGVSIPEDLEKFVHEARQCYAFQQYLAVYSMSRTILEAAIRDIGQKKAKLPRDKGNVRRWELRNFNHMKNKVVPKHLKDEVDQIYDRTSGLIHGNKVIGKEDAKNMFKRALEIVQKVYDYYNLS